MDSVASLASAFGVSLVTLVIVDLNSLSIDLDFFRYYFGGIVALGLVDLISLGDLNFGHLGLVLPGWRGLSLDGLGRLLIPDAGCYVQCGFRFISHVPSARWLSRLKANP